MRGDILRLLLLVPRSRAQDERIWQNFYPKLTLIRNS